MKRIFLIIAACATALTLGSCQKNQNKQEEFQPDEIINLADYDEITADFPEDFFMMPNFDGTKSMVNYTTESWEDGDSIVVFLQMVLGKYGGVLPFEYRLGGWHLTVNPKIALAIGGGTTVSDIQQKFIQLYPKGVGQALYMSKMNGEHQKIALNKFCVQNILPEMYVSSSEIGYSTSKVTSGNTLNFSFWRKGFANVVTPNLLVVDKYYYEKYKDDFSSLMQVSTVGIATTSTAPDKTPNTIYHNCAPFDNSKVSSPYGDKYYFFLPEEEDLSNFGVRVNEGYNWVKDTLLINGSGCEVVFRNTITRFR